MSADKSPLTRLFLRAERHFDRLRRYRRRRYGIVRPVEIVPYLGYGSSERIFVKGRVLEDKGIERANAGDSRWRNLVNTYKRFISDEVPGAELEVAFGGKTYPVRTDAKGYFGIWLEPGPLSAAAPWHEATLRLAGAAEEVKAPVMVPPPDARFGVISDIDDTVVQTDATKWLRVVSTVLFGNARTRLPFAGVAAFYRALQGGHDGKGFNPLFYVSSSPWNLYDLLLDFFEAEDIPRGPLTLRNWRDSAESSLIPKEHAPFKKSAIRRILATFPELPFILIGDSGQEDPEIYRDIVAEYPGRILAVYIRNVSGASARSADVRGLARKVREAGSNLVLANDTLAAARHALAHGWISSSALNAIRARKEEDEVHPQETPPLVIDGEEVAAGRHEQVR